MQGIPQKVLLVFPAELGEGIHPIYQVNRVAFVAMPHPFQEEGSVVVALLGRQLQRFIEIAAGQVGCRQGIFPAQAFLPHQPLAGFLVAQCFDMDDLAARENGVENEFLLLGYQYEDGIFRGLFNDLKQAVAFFTEKLRQPHDQDLIVVLESLQAELFNDVDAFLLRNVTLFVFSANALQPLVDIEVGIFADRLPPVGEEVVANGFGPNGRVGEMEVGMDELRGFIALVAYPTSIGCTWIFAEQVLR